MTTPAPSLRLASLRAAGAAVAVFILANLAGEALRPPFDTLDDWVSLPDPAWLRHLLSLLLAVTLLGAARGEAPRILRRAGALLTLAVVLVALADAAGFYVALARGRIHTPAVVPASLAVAALFAALSHDLARARRPAARGWPGALAAGAAMITILVAVPVIRMLTFGPTRYERSADAAVVFGARVWDDGTPSDALADRVDESIRLYREGRVHHLVMSGGIDRRNHHSEPEVMRARAEAAGVPREAILLDEGGDTTKASVTNVARLLRERGLATALVVTHYYHEPRCKMLFDRSGVRAFTVPATMKRRLLKEPYFVAREVLAFYHSFLTQ